MVFAKRKVLIPLRRRDKRWKVFNERKERYHRYIVQSAFSEYYETGQIGILTYIEDESFLPKRKPKRKRKRKI
jgi:hypothetical protein